MKTSLLLKGLVAIVCALPIGPAYGQIHAFDASRLSDKLDRLHEIDFENLSLGASPFSPSLPNPLTIDGVTIADPTGLSGGFCSAPTCLADPDNPYGGNIELILNPGATLSFATAPRLVVLDIQGIGDNPFELLVTDEHGRDRRVQDQGVSFGQSLLGLYSGGGIRKVELVQVGGTGGPLALASVLVGSGAR